MLHVTGIYDDGGTVSLPNCRTAGDAERRADSYALHCYRVELESGACERYIRLGGEWVVLPAYDH
jgi:hypothetical protein